MILTPEGEVAAVVDWELCTLGDPLADVGLLMVYWPKSGEEATSLGQPANLAPGFPDRDELRRRYAERSGRDLDRLDFYVALGYWKLAIILEGVYARYTAGGYGKVDSGVEYFAEVVERLAEAAEQAEARLHA
jgi:aminoglycoside phosphotransferase (APT) family kinase protein